MRQRSAGQLEGLLFESPLTSAEWNAGTEVNASFDGIYSRSIARGYKILSLQTLSENYISVMKHRANLEEKVAPESRHCRGAVLAPTDFRKCIQILTDFP